MLFPNEAYTTDTWSANQIIAYATDTRLNDAKTNLSAYLESLIEQQAAVVV